MLPDSIRPGQTLEFSYPVHNRWGIPLEHRRRIIAVVSVRDIRRDPLDSSTLVEAPLRRRGTVLISGIDHETGESRSFWWESMQFAKLKNQQPLPQLQLAIIPHDEPDDSPEPVGPAFRQSPFDSLVLSATIRHLREAFPQIEERYRVVVVPAESAECSR